MYLILPQAQPINPLASLIQPENSISGPKPYFPEIKNQTYINLVLPQAQPITPLASLIEPENGISGPRPYFPEIKS
jgi:hypothetical protein